MKAHMVWSLDATMGAVNALTEHSREITHDMMERAEELAIERSKVDGYEPAIITDDVLQAIKEG